MEEMADRGQYHLRVAKTFIIIIVVVCYASDTSHRKLSTL